MLRRPPTSLLVAVIAATAAVALLRQRPRRALREHDRALVGALLALHEVQRLAAHRVLQQPLAADSRSFAWRQLRMSEAGIRQASALDPIQAPFGEQIGDFGRALLSTLDDGGQRDIGQAYGRAMVRAHQEALIWLNERLLPAAWDPTVRQALERARRQTLARLDGALQLLRDTPEDVAHDAWQPPLPSDADPSAAQPLSSPASARP